MSEQRNSNPQVSISQPVLLGDSNQSSLRAVKTSSAIPRKSDSLLDILRREDWAPIGALLIVGSLFLGLLPLLFNEIPPLVDYPNHLARDVVLNGGELLRVSRFYSANWTIVPNLGGDILLIGLLRLFEPAVAGRILLAIVIAVDILGTVLYSRVVFGRWSWWSLGAVLTAYNGLFLFGFVNFSLACGLAFLAAAAWRALRESHPLTAAIVVGHAMVAIWFTHLDGAILALLLIGAQETTVVVRNATGPSALVRLMATRLPPALVLVVIPLALYFISDISAVDTGVIWGWSEKWRRLFLPIASYYPSVDFVVALCSLGVLALAAARKRLQFDPASVGACAVCCLLFAASPLAVKSGYWVDVRFAVMAWMLIFAGFIPAFDGGLLVRSAALLAGAATVKIFAVTIAWNQAGHDIADTRHVLGCVPAGGRVISALRTDGNAVPRYRELAFVRYGIYGHLGAWAVIDEDAYWPALFAYRGQQPLVLRPTYATTDRAASLGALPFKVLLEAVGEGGRQRLTPFARTFDFILVSGSKGTVPQQIEGAEIEADSAFSTLLRVARSTSPKKTCR